MAQHAKMSINVIHHINKIEGQKPHDPLKNAEKEFDKAQQPFMVKRTDRKEHKRTAKTIVKQVTKWQ